MKDAENTALRIASYTAQSESRLSLKLTKKGFGSDIIESVTEKLKEYGYLNDGEYARNWLLSRIKKKPESRKTLFYGLLKQGIERSLAETTIREIITDDIEEECAARLIDKLLRIKELTEDQLRKKLYSGGFPARIINEVLRQNQ